MRLGDSFNGGSRSDAAFYASIELEAEQQLNEEVEALNEQLKKYMIERHNLQKKLDAKISVEWKKRQVLIEEELSKKRFKDDQSRLKQRQKLERKAARELEDFKKAEERAARKEHFEEQKRINEELTAAYGVSLRRNMQDALNSLKVDGLGTQIGSAFKKAGTQALANGVKQAAASVDQAMTMYAGVYSGINARLQSSGNDAKNIVGLMNKNLAVSPFVKYEDMLNNVSSMVEAGIAYNVEQRAFLATISDKIATTFDAANGTLLKIIRIQQEDSTRARLGMEASITKFLNSNFQDTSYLTDVFDDVSSAIADSVVQLGTQGGAEYEHTLQKWLSSLYSLGMSSGTVTNLASALNMLSTGDVSGLEGSGMQNLLVMAANRAGVNYGDLLTNGVNASNIDALMSNIVGYWGELSNNNNQVVRKQYANLFGLDMADLVAIRNIDEQTLKDIQDYKLSYTGMNQELNTQLSQVAGRLHVSELINNAYENAVSGIGRSIAGSPGMMATWLINDMIKEATGGINIPFITALGSGIGLETDLNSIVQLGMVGAGALGQIGNIIGGLGSNGGLNMNSWKAEDVTRHGSGLGAVVTGVQTSTSSTTFVGNSSGSDMYSSSLNKAYDDVDKSVAAENADEADKLKQSIVEHIDPNIQSLLKIMESVHTGTALRVTVDNYGLTSTF